MDGYDMKMTKKIIFEFLTLIPALIFGHFISRVLLQESTVKWEIICLVVSGIITAMTMAIQIKLLEKKS